MSDSTPELLAKQFFNSATVPITNHQEWLLRHYFLQMQREASLISVQRGEIQKQTPIWKSLSHDLNASTTHSIKMDTQTSTKF